MTKISIYIRAKDVSPSGYYRILQYTNRLKGPFFVHNILSPWYYKKYLSCKRNKWLKFLVDPLTFSLMFFRCCSFLLFDYISGVEKIIISRGLFPKLFPTCAKYLLSINLQKSSLIWDFDDDILNSREISKSEFVFLSQYSKVIVVTHSYLAHLIDKKNCQKVRMLPTTDGDFLNYDFGTILRKRIDSFGKELRLVWIGSAINLSQLNEVVGLLDNIACNIKNKLGKQLVLNICSSSFLDYSPKYIRINNILWTRQNAIDIVLESHIGIMPLQNNEYSLGKGGFKMVQYMASGLPIIGSAVGYNNQIVDSSIGFLIYNLNEISEWYQAIEILGSNAHNYQCYSKYSYEKWNNQFSYYNNLRVWKSLLE